MSAYVIVEISITDHTEYEAYKKLTPASIAAFDGKFIVRGAKTESLEGNWQPERMVVVEFPSVERAKEWWNSDEYSIAKEIRQRSQQRKCLLLKASN